MAPKNRRKRSLARPAWTDGKFDWIRFAGAVMLLWCAVNTGVSIYRYGVEQGIYWWFCNCALFGVGVALWNHHTGWIAGFLAIATFTQTFWIFDNLWRITTGSNLIGLVEFMYQPGNPFDEFLLSHYHFFIMPTGFIALAYLKRKKPLSRAMVVATNAFIFGVSYFVFPKSQNVNCIHEPCLSSIEHWGGPLWAASFFTVVCLGCLFVKEAIEKFFDGWKPAQAQRRAALHAYMATVVGAVLMTGLDIREKLAVPSLTCDAPVTADGIRSGCRYTLEHEPGVLAFYYGVDNRGTQAQTCATYLEYDGQKEILDDSLTLEPGARATRRKLLAYPRRNTHVRVTAQCEGIALK